MCVIAKNQKAFTSSLSKKKDIFKSKIDELVFPDFIEETNEEMFEQLVVELSNKYSDKNYKYFDREELYQEKGWSDLEVLCLLKFYKNKWSIQVPNAREYFPNFIFTYSPETLAKEIENTVTKAYQVIQPLNLQSILKRREWFTALDITYLLHYFALNHTDYKD
jgi:hypothetical protein